MRWSWTAAAGVVALALFATWAAAQEGPGWAPFEPKEDFGPSVIDLSGWLDAPAGKHGFVTIQGERFVFEDGTPVKFWGSNICDSRPGSDRATAERWAAKLAKYGINCIRFHKWTDPGEATRRDRPSTELDPAFMDRMDYFVSQLRQRGIYTGWSHIYGHEITPADRERLMAYDEIAALRTSTGLVNFAPDLQDINIELTLNLLNHRNPYTGLRYADDAALAFIEFQNEDDIFWGATKSAVDRCPTYRKYLCQQFSRWLKQKYGTHEALVAAWGAGAFDQGEYQQGVTEHLDQENIYPVCHFWWYSPQGLQAKAAQRRRLLDSARFLYETQNAFYARFAEAIRKAGYRGPLIGSCWQAGSGIPHFYNLHSDALVGIIDRHNYSGGGTGHRLAVGNVNADATVDRPGSGILSSGMQQVAGRPFALSEWICCIPNEWVAEGPPIVAAYGMGLQGWDASYSFATNYDTWTPTIEAPWVYNVDSPTQLAQYPALAMMIYRGDLKEGEPVAVRRVHVPSLADGVLGVEETVQQEGDVKVFSGQTPQEALAIGKVLVEFTEQPQPSYLAELERWWDRQARVIRSTTGQLAWHYGKRGFFTIDSPGTQAVVGFAGGRRIELTNVTIQPTTGFCSLFVSSLDKQKGIAEAPALLITAIARAQNTGMQYSPDRRRVVAVGTSPIQLEIVQGSITIKGRGKPTVYVLDHVGHRLQQTVPVTMDGQDATFVIGTHPAIYYEVVY